jgi:hypothetical protein
MGWTGLMLPILIILMMRTTYFGIPTLNCLMLYKKKVRFNRNIHKMSPFMTAGLLVSCVTKNHLFKTKLLDNSPANIQKYKDFKTVYSKTLRAAKKLYFQQKLEANVTNPKKTLGNLK